MASVFIRTGRILSIIKNSRNNKIVINPIRNYAIQGTKLIYTKYGEPHKVVRDQCEIVEEKIQSNELLIKMLASPVNPADINTIQGKYPVKPPLPSVPGNEGVGTIIQIGSQVTHFKIGDKVVFLVNSVGTWRTHVAIPSHFVLKIPDELRVYEAATLTVNPCTAYRVLKDFICLEQGDTVIQNGGNSAVGQCVIQIAKSMCINTVNIIRNRPGVEDLKNYLYSLGATYVLTEEELRKTDIFKSNCVKRPRLALNCVGGKSSVELLRHLVNGGTMVTYGGMSREPVMAPTGKLIFSDVILRGFWMTEWSKNNYGTSERTEMFDNLINMMLKDELKTSKLVPLPLSKYQEALSDALNPAGMSGKKYIFDFTC